MDKKEDKPAPDRKTWKKLEKQFRKQDAEEKRRDPQNRQHRRLCACADLCAANRKSPPSGHANTLVYTIYGGLDEHFRERVIRTVTEAGLALGASRKESVERWLAYVQGEAIKNNWRGDNNRAWWHPVPQRFGKRTAGTNTGQLDYLCLASATACLRLYQQAAASGSESATDLAMTGRERMTRSELIDLKIEEVERETGRKFNRQKFARVTGYSLRNLQLFQQGKATPDVDRAVTRTLNSPAKTIVEILDKKTRH